MKIGASLARVSTAEQATKTSLDTQLAENRLYATRAGLVIPQHFEFQDDVSGTIPVKERPNAGRVYELVQGGAIQAVVISTFDRTTRDEKVLEYLIFKSYLHEHGVELHYADTGLDPFTMEGNLLGYIKSFGSAKERRDIIARTTKGRRDRAAAGLPPCGVPLGYTIVRDAKGISIGCQFDEAYRPIFDELARHFLDGRTYVDTALALGIHPLTGRGWTWGDVRRMLNNPFYRGHIAYGYKARSRKEPYFVVRGTHEPVWDQATCQMIESELERRRRRGQRTPKTRTPGLLDGLLYCGYCGWPMRIRSSNMVGGRRLRMYGCGTWLNRPGYNGHNPRHVSDCIIETKVIRLVDGLLSSLTPEKFIARFAERGRPALDAGRLRWLLEQRQSVQEQADEIAAELDSVRTPTARSALQAERKRLEAQAQELEGQIQTERRAEVVLPDNYADELMRFLQAGDWKQRPAGDVRQALRYLKFHIREGELVPPPTP